MKHNDVLKANFLKVIFRVVLFTCLSTTMLGNTTFGQHANTPTTPAEQTSQHTSQQGDIQGDIRRAAHSERIDINISNLNINISNLNISNLANMGTTDPTLGSDPRLADDIEVLGVFLDGKPYDDYQLSEDGIILNMPADTRLEHSHFSIDTNYGRIEQTFEFVASFGSSNLVALVEGQSEQEFRRYVTALGMQLSSFYTVLGGDLSLAEVQLNDQSSARGLQQLHAMQQVASQNSNAAPLWVSSPQMLYKPLRRIHSLDPSCALWSELQDVTQRWRPLFLAASSGQVGVLEALSVSRAHARGDSGRGVSVFVLDSASATGDRFDCGTRVTASTQGHGRYIQDIVQAVAPAADVTAIPVCKADGACLTRDIAGALLSLQTILATGKPVIVTLALGSPPHPELGIDAVVYHSLERLSRRYDNLLVVASAGNNGLDGRYQSTTARLPAGFWQGDWQDAQGTPLAPLDNLLSVGGIGLQTGNNPFDYDVTPFNPQVPISMLAPAARLCLPHPDGGCAPDGSDQGLSGSSFATPFVAGAAALFWEACPNVSASDLRSWLLQDSNFDILIGGRTPTIPVVNAYRTQACPAATFDTLPEMALLEPLTLAINQRYPLYVRTEALAELAFDVADPRATDHYSDAEHLADFLIEHGQWRSLDANIASIDASGRVHAHSAGEVTLSLHLLAPDPQQPVPITKRETARVIAQITLTVPPYRCDDPPTIADPALAQRMAERWGTPLSCDVMAQAERLFAMELDISNLDGLAYAPNLRWLNLGKNALGDGDEGVLEPLAYLPQLETLYLFDNNLGQHQLAPLNQLSNLQLLSLHDNAISDISVWQDAAFTNLVELFLDHNNLRDITPLQRLTQLHTLNLEGNHIRDLRPLTGLRQLTSLNLAANDLEDVHPLAGLPLEDLTVFDNAINNLRPLATSSTLRSLNVNNNAISDLRPLAGLTNLSQLELARNPISTIAPLRHLTLTLLDISGSAVSDLSPLQTMSTLATLRAAYVNLRDITPLANKRFLTELDVSGNPDLGTTPQTLEVLASLINLRHLDVSLTGLPAGGLAPLHDLAALHTLRASSNRISDLTPLRHLPRLSQLDLRSNHIRDLNPLVANTALNHETTLRLTGNDLLFQPQDALSDIQTLQTRGIALEIEDLSGGLPASYLVRFEQDAHTLTGRAPDNRDDSHVSVRPYALQAPQVSDVADVWFEVFAPGSYRTTQYANQGWMLRLRGTTLCISANTPHNGMNVTLWRCLPDDPWQQWHLQPQTEQTHPAAPTTLSASQFDEYMLENTPTPWRLVMPDTNGEAFCVYATSDDDPDSSNTSSSNTSSSNTNNNVVMWRCDERGEGVLWQIEQAAADIFEHGEIR